MDVAANVAAIIFFGFLLSEAIAEGMTSWRIRETADGLIQFPLYPARWILISGTVMLLLQLGLHTIQDLGRVSSGEELEERDDLPPIPGLPDLPDPNSFDRKP